MTVYTKVTWAADTRITAVNFNHFETQFDDAYYEFMYGHTHNTRYYTKSSSDTTFFWTGFMGSGSGADADTLDSYQASSIINAAFPVGSIVWWKNSAGSVPSGWHVCDGTGGTTDYRDRFVIGAGSTYNVQTTPGWSSVTPTGSVTIGNTTLSIGELPSHLHTYVDTYEYADYVITPTGGGGGASNIYSEGEYEFRTTTTATDGGTGGSHNHTSGSSVTYNSESNMPPYYALYLIIRQS